MALPQPSPNQSSPEGPLQITALPVLQDNYVFVLQRGRQAVVVDPQSCVAANLNAQEYGGARIIEARDRPWPQVFRQHPHPRPRAQRLDQAEAVAAGAAPDRKRPGPRPRIGGNEWLVVDLGLGQLRQIEEGDLGCPEHQRACERCRTRRPRRQIVQRAILDQRLKPTGGAVGERQNAQIDLAPVMIEPQHIARVQRQPGRWRGGGLHDRIIGRGPAPPLPRVLEEDVRAVVADLEVHLLLAGVGNHVQVLVQHTIAIAVGAG